MVRCRRVVGDGEVHSLLSGSFLPVTLATGPQFPHLHNTSVSGNSPSWLTAVLGTQLVKGGGVTGGLGLVRRDGLMSGLCVAEGVGGVGCFVCFELEGAFLPLVPSWVGAGQGDTASARSPPHSSRWSLATPPLPQQAAFPFVSLPVEL